MEDKCKKVPISDDDFKKLVLEIRSDKKSPEFRLGQWSFNKLYEIRPDIADEIRGTENDPFYRDEKLGKFLTAVVLYGI